MYKHIKSELLRREISFRFEDDAFHFQHPKFPEVLNCIITEEDGQMRFIADYELLTSAEMYGDKLCSLINKINYDKLAELLEFQIANKTDAIIICGTTGEGSTLTVYERLKPAVEDDEECYITSIDFADESSIICNRGYGGTVSIIDPFGNGNHIKNKVNYYMNTKRQKEVFDEFIKTNPMILCRTNKQVKAIQEFGYTNVSTVHQAKGLEYDNVIVVDTTIRNMEDLNIAYVALTRARDNMLVINWSNLEQMWLQERSKPSGFG